MTKQDIHERLTGIAVDLFKVPAATVMDLKVGMEPWDSMGHLELFMAIEGQWGIKFTMDEIIRLSSLDEIVDNIAQKVGT